jgi:hypothetical protein
MLSLLALIMVILLSLFAAAAIMVGWVWILVLAFQEGIGWGVGAILFSPIGLVFAFLNLDRTAKPLLIFGAGMFAMVVTLILVPLAGIGVAPH